MKGSVGTTTSIYHTRLPHQWELERMMASPYAIIFARLKRGALSSVGRAADS